MRRYGLPLAIVLALGTVGFAQIPDTQGSPSSQSGSQAGQQSPSSTSPSSTMGQGSMSQTDSEKGDKKLKGCLRSENGQFILDEKHGKQVMLSGQDLSAHVGHEIEVHGRYGSGSSMSGSSTSSPSSTSPSSTTTGSASGSMSAGGDQFVVDSLKMVSESCKMDHPGKKPGSNSGTGTQPQPQK